jgi:hypothetical protein
MDVRDDNALSFCSPDFDLLISTLEFESKILIEWFRVNKMQANPDTPLWMSAQPLRTLLTFICCFRFDK